MRPFPVYCALTLTKLYCYDIFSLPESIFPGLWAKPQPKNAKMSLPVYVRRSLCDAPSFGADSSFYSVQYM